jgi:hypothetical protein
VAFFCASFVLVRAGEDDGPRNLKVDVKSDEVTADSELEDDADGKSKFRFRMRTKDDGIKVEITSLSIDESIKDKRQFTVYFQKLVQYEGADAYNGGAMIGEAYELSKQNWADFSCPVADGKYKCTARTADGVFTAEFEFAAATFTSNGLTLSSDDMKITVTINKFPYSKDATDKTRLALFVYGKAKIDYKEKEVSGSQKKVYTGGAAFEWETSATADSADIEVTASPPQFGDEGSDKKFSLWFSFGADKPDLIVWDPTVSSDDSSSSSLVPLGFLVLMAIAFAQLF